MFARKIAVGIASIAITAGVGVSTAGPASAAVRPGYPSSYSNCEGLFAGDGYGIADRALSQIRRTYPAQARAYSDYTLRLAGRDNARERNRLTFLTIGYNRDRVLNETTDYINRKYFGGRQYGIARLTLNFPNCAG